MLHSGQGHAGMASKALGLGIVGGGVSLCARSAQCALGVGRLAGRLAIRGIESLESRNGEEHTKNARPSTQEKHQKGRARNQQDYGGEKGDSRRDGPRKKPPGTKGPWPPK